MRIEREFAIRERLLKRVQLRIERLMDDPMTTSRLGKDIAKKYNRKLNDTLSQHRKTKIILELKKIFPSVKKGMGEELNKE